MWPRSIRRLPLEQEITRAEELARVTRDIDLKNTVAHARREASYLVAVIRASKGPRWRPAKRNALKSLYQARVRARTAVRALNIKAAQLL